MQGFCTELKTKTVFLVLMCQNQYLIKATYVTGHVLTVDGGLSL